MAAGRFTCAGPSTGGRRDWISAVMRVLALAMARRDRTLPRHVVVAVATDRVYVLGSRWRRVGRELRSWHRAALKASADRTDSRWNLWIQPPGDAPGFELRSVSRPDTDAVVAALTAAR